MLTVSSPHEGTDGPLRKSLLSLFCSLDRNPVPSFPARDKAQGREPDYNTSCVQGPHPLSRSLASEHGTKVASQLEARPSLRPGQQQLLGPAEAPLLSALTPFSQVKDQEARTAQVASRRRGDKLGP